MSQPVWKTIQETDCTRLQIDETGVYDPELEVACKYEESKGNTRFLLHRFPLSKLTSINAIGIKRKILVDSRLLKSCPKPSRAHEEWFSKSLNAVTRTVGSSKEDLVSALMDEDPRKRIWAYEAIGSHHGYDKLDSYPLDLSEEELDRRWK